MTNQISRPADSEQKFSTVRRVVGASRPTQAQLGYYDACRELERAMRARKEVLNTKLFGVAMPHQEQLKRGNSIMDALGIVANEEPDLIPRLQARIARARDRVNHYRNLFRTAGWTHVVPRESRPRAVLRCRTRAVRVSRRARVVARVTAKATSTGDPGDGEPPRSPAPLRRAGFEIQIGGAS